MRWPFSRSEAATPGASPAEPGGRPNEPRDPASELRTQTRRRLIGAAVLLLAAVIVLPMVLDSAPRPVRDDIVIAVATPPPEVPPARMPEARPPAADAKIAEPAPPRPEPESGPTPEPKPAPPAAPAADPGPAGPAGTAPPKPPPVPAAGKDRFVVQVVALSSPAAADDLKARLVKGGFSAYVEAVATTNGTLHRVRVGPFSSRDEAQRAVDRLKSAGHRAAVVGG